jgi:hypothetical protein
MSAARRIEAYRNSRSPSSESDNSWKSVLLIAKNVPTITSLIVNATGCERIKSTSAVQLASLIAQKQ